MNLREMLDQVREDWHNLGKVQAEAMTHLEREHIIARSQPAPGTVRSWAMGELTNPDDTTDAVGGW